MDVEQRAIEILCGEIDLNPEDYDEGERINAGEAIRAIITALTPPEGFVLVPVEPTQGMIDAYDQMADQGDGQRLRLAPYQAMLSARPEVNP